jgi:multisubunit Na+/H+ antiporter MnhC subunit
MHEIDTHTFSSFQETVMSNVANANAALGWAFIVTALVVSTSVRALLGALRER